MKDSYFEPHVGLLNIKDVISGVGAMIVGTIVVGAMIVGAMSVGAMIVGAMSVGAMIVGAMIVGAMRRPPIRLVYCEKKKPGRKEAIIIIV